MELNEISLRVIRN